jgi:signal transduction histidine kinase
MGHDWLVPLAAAFANAIIAACVLWRGAGGSTTRAFAWMGTTAMLWNLDIFALYYFDDIVEAEWWSRIFRVGVCFAPVAAYHFTRLLTEYREPVWRRLDVAGHVVAAAFAVIGLFPGTLVEKLEPHRWGYYIEPTRLYAPVALSIVLYITLAVLLMWRRYNDPVSARQREQAKLFFVAGFLLVPFVLTNVVAIYVDGFYPLGNLGNVLWLAIIAYAIVRHRFMDLDYVVRKVVSFALASAAVLVPSALLVSVLGRLTGVEVPVVLASAVAASGLLAALFIPTLQHAIETRVHRAIYAHRYDYRLRLRELASDLVHVLDERALVSRLGEALADILEVDGCGIYLRDERQRQLVQQFPDSGAVIDGPMLDAVERLVEPLLTGELEAAGSPVAGLFRANAWEVGIPLRANDRLTGLVGVGRNRDFRMVSQEDLQILAGVASATSVALENARLSRELRRSESALERANRLSSIGTLAAGIAHEIRNPLTAVKTFLDLLPQRLNDQDFVTSFRELSLAELKRVTNLINDLLAFGKSTSAERRPVDLGAIVDQVVRLLESTARKRLIQLELRIRPGVPPAWADPDQIKQIVLNLVLNAIEASPANRAVTLALFVDRGRMVTLEVRDQGAGIPADQLESIFHPFFTTKEQGTGLGLSLVHQMVVEHGGQISVESEVGRGTVFRVLLPVAEVALRHSDRDHVSVEGNARL